MRKRQVVQLLEELCSKSMTPVTRNGSPLGKGDNQTVQEVYQSWMLLLLDLDYLDLSNAPREWGRLAKGITSGDVLTTCEAFATMLQMVYQGSPLELSRFKALSSEISPNLFNLIRVDLLAVHNDNCVFAAKRLIQCFAYCTRLSLRGIDLQEQCLADYMSTEQHLFEVSQMVKPHYLRYIKKIIKGWFSKIDLSDLMVGHSNGSTAGSVRNLLQKYRGLSPGDGDLQAIFGLSYLPNFIRDQHDLQGNILPLSSLDRISHTIFVPKSYKTFRTISMESACLMYYQQGVWREIDDFVRSHTYLRQRIGFSDQSRNRDLAREGSFSRLWATVDLSAASDSVSYELVEFLFGDTPLLPYLIATRSPRTLLPDGRLIHLRKFAPMGSALCFPIETIIFAAICEFVTREHGKAGRFSVFGDDIIVPTDCYPDLAHVLDALGFLVNTSKSFFDEDCWFRESCGGEYCDGFDVTPLRISRKFHADNDIIAVSGLTDMAKESQIKGFQYLRSYFIHLALNRRKGYIPLFGGSGIRTTSPSNFHARRKWDDDTQSIMVEVTAVKQNTHDKDGKPLRFLRNTSYLFRDEILYHEAQLSAQRRDRAYCESRTPWHEYQELPIIEVAPSQSGGRAVHAKAWLTKEYEDNDAIFIASHLPFHTGTLFLLWNGSEDILRRFYEVDLSLDLNR